MEKRPESMQASDLTEATFRLLVDSLQDYAVFMLSPQGQVRTWNLGAQRLKGYAPSEIIGKHFSVFYPAEDMASGRPRRMLERAAREGRAEDESWRLRSDGSRFWANVVITALRNEESQLIGFAKVTRDLTTRKHAEDTQRELIKEQTARALAEESEARVRAQHRRYEELNRRFEVILDGIADGITVQDSSGRLIFANRAGARNCGFESAEELLRADLRELHSRFRMYDEKGSLLLPEMLPNRKVLAGESAGSALVRVRRLADGDEWWTLLRASAVRNEAGELLGVVNTWHDTTAEHRREEHERYLAKASEVFGHSQELPAMLSAFADLAVLGFADWCSIYLLEGDELRNVAVAHKDPACVARAQEFVQRYKPHPDDPHGLWRIVRSGKSELHSTISDDLLQRAARDEHHLEMLRQVGMSSAIVVPITIRASVQGCLSFVSAESGRRYDAADLGLAEELSRRLGAAVENVRLQNAERQARTHLEFIVRAGELLSSSLDYEATLNNIVRLTLPALADFAFFDLVEEDHVQRTAHAHEDPELEAILAKSQWQRSERTDKNLCALSSGRSGFNPEIDDAFLQDVATSPEHLVLLRKLQLCSMVTVPTVAGGVVVGSLTCCFGSSKRRHTVADLRLAEELARRAGVAITQARLFAEAKRAAREAEEVSRIKDEFLATVSHELRTPLNAIVGWSSLLKGRSLEPQVAKGVEVIYRNAQAQAKIIEDILDVSRIITGKLRLDLKPIDLVTAVCDALEVVRPSALAKGIELVFHPPEEPRLLVADPERLQQVIWNLLSNAVKFTDQGGNVTICIEQTDKRLRVSVADTGGGIDPEFLPFVFDRFKQADGSTTRRFGGLGLGLAIVRHIVELHGGNVRAESPGTGQGSTFSITLPVRQNALALVHSEGEVTAPTATEVWPMEGSLLGLRLLVVDDEPDARELVTTLLESLGASVAQAGSAAEAVRVFREFQPHVLITDIGMPEEDGYGLLRRVRSLGPASGGDVPAIAVTAYARAEDQARAIGAGFAMHLGKPVRPQELVAAVIRVTKRFPVQK